VKGYLIDNEGNIINAKGEVVFEKEEIESDGDIPAPF
jgi:hypothetical protein